MWGVIGYEVTDPGVSPPNGGTVTHITVTTCEPVHPKVPKSAYQTKQRGGVLLPMGTNEKPAISDGLNQSRGDRI